MIETVAIFGKKSQTRTLAVAIAATRKVLVDVYAPTPQDIGFYMKAAGSAQLPPLSLLFTRSVHNTAWGADAIILDSLKHIQHLSEIAQAANDTAIITFTGGISKQDIGVLKDAVSHTTLTYVPPSRMKHHWPDFPLIPV